MCPSRYYRYKYIHVTVDDHDSRWTLTLEGHLIAFHLKFNLRHSMKFYASFVFCYIIIRNHSSLSSSIPCSVPVRILRDKTHNKMNKPSNLYLLKKTMSTHIEEPFKLVLIGLFFKMHGNFTVLKVFKKHQVCTQSYSLTILTLNSIT